VCQTQRESKDVARCTVDLTQAARNRAECRRGFAVSPSARRARHLRFRAPCPTCRVASASKSMSQQPRLMLLALKPPPVAAVYDRRLEFGLFSRRRGAPCVRPLRRSARHTWLPIGRRQAAPLHSESADSCLRRQAKEGSRSPELEAGSLGTAVIDRRYRAASSFRSAMAPGVTLARFVLFVAFCSTSDK